MDQANLSGMGEYAVRQTARVGQAGTASEEQKKREDADRRVVQTALERQRKDMADALADQIEKLRETIVKDQERADALRRKSAALDDLNSLILSNQIDLDNPAHIELMTEAGIEDPDAFMAKSQEARQEQIEESKQETESELGKVVDKLAENLDKLNAAMQAQEDLSNGVSMEEIQKQLDQAGITLEGKPKNAEELSNNLDLAADGYEETALSFEDKFYEMNDQDKAEILAKMEQDNRISEEDVSMYREMLGPSM